MFWKLFFAFPITFIIGFSICFPKKARLLFDFLRMKSRKLLLSLLGVGHAMSETQTEYYVSYYWGEEIFTIYVPKRRGPSRPVMRIQDHVGNDITNKIFQLAGPFCNFHGMRITPGKLGFKSITLVLFGEDNKMYTEEEEIVM